MPFSGVLGYDDSVPIAHVHRVLSPWGYLAAILWVAAGLLMFAIGRLSFGRVLGIIALVATVACVTLQAHRMRQPQQ